MVWEVLGGGNAQGGERRTCGKVRVSDRGAHRLFAHVLPRCRRELGRPRRSELRGLSVELGLLARRQRQRHPTIDQILVTGALVVTVLGPRSRCTTEAAPACTRAVHPSRPSAAAAPSVRPPSPAFARRPSHAAAAAPNADVGAASADPRRHRPLAAARRDDATCGDARQRACRHPGQTRTPGAGGGGARESGPRNRHLRALSVFPPKPRRVPCAVS